MGSIHTMQTMPAPTQAANSYTHARKNKGNMPKIGRENGKNVNSQTSIFRLFFYWRPTKIPFHRIIGIVSVCVCDFEEHSFSLRGIKLIWFGNKNHENKDKQWIKRMDDVDKQKIGGNKRRSYENWFFSLLHSARIRLSKCICSWY